MKILSSVRSFLAGVNHNVLSFISKVSPYVLQQMKPILTTAGEDLWKVAYPLAVQIVNTSIANGFGGYDAHTANVKTLEAAVIATGKFAIGAVEKLHLGQIIMTAYANSPEVLKILAAAATIAAAVA